MNEHTPSEPASAQAQHDRLRPLIHRLRDAWLHDLNLHDAFYDPLHHLGTTPLADQIAQQLGINRHDTHATIEAVTAWCTTYLHTHAIAITDDDYTYIRDRIRDDLFGRGLLEPLLSNPNVAEIMVNDPQHIYISERGRVPTKYAPVFDHADHLIRTIHHLLLPLGERIDQENPMRDIHLANGTHILVIIPPLAINGASITIIKRIEETLILDDLIRFGSLTPAMADMLHACIDARLNMIICGGTGSGMTTLLAVVTQLIHHSHRIVTIEDIPSIQVYHEHVVALQCQPPNSTGTGGTTMRELIRMAAMMRPERIIVGNLTGDGALDALQVMGRGHDGSIIHMFADTPSDALERIEMMVKFTHPDIPATYLRYLIGARRDIIAHVNRQPDGTRKLTLTEVLAMRDAGYELHNIYTFQRTGTTEQGNIAGEFCSTLVSEHLEQRLHARGIFLPSIMRAEEYRLSTPTHAHHPATHQPTHQTTSPPS